LPTPIRDFKSSLQTLIAARHSLATRIQEQYMREIANNLNEYVYYYYYSHYFFLMSTPPPQIKQACHHPTANPSHVHGINYPLQPPNV